MTREEAISAQGAEIGRLCRAMTMIFEERNRLRAALEAELKFWRNQPSPFRHDLRIVAIEAALGVQQNKTVTEEPR